MTDMPEEIWEKIEVCKSTNCWNWTGYLEKRGYGRHKNKYAHRITFEQANGEILHGLVVDHLCRNKKCVNPDHLEAVPQKINVARGAGLTAKNMEKTHCTNGHEDNEENTRIAKRNDGTRRVCKVCDRIYKRKKRDEENPSREKRKKRMVNYGEE